MSLAWQSPSWLGTVVVLTLGTCVVVCLAAFGARWACSVVWQRTWWQISLLGLLTLLAAEVTGTSAGFVQWGRLQAARRLGSQVDQDSVFAENGQVVSAAPQQLATWDWGTPDPGSSPAMGDVHVVPTQPVAGTQVGRALLPVASDPTGESARPTNRVQNAPGQTRMAETPTGDARPDDKHTATSVGPRPIATAVHEDSSQNSAGCYLAVAWMIGSAILLARMARARWLLECFRRRQAPVDDRDLGRRVARLARRLGMRRRVAVLEATGLATPIAFGVFRPVIVLPASFADEFDAHEQEAMLAHELAHLAAGDPAWQIVADLSVVILWWHPLAWWARRKWRAAGELAADEACLLVPQGANALAASLVALARRVESCRQLAWLAMAEPGFRSALGQRVERLLDLSGRTWQMPTRGRISVMTATVLVALVLVAVSCTAWARTQVPLTEGATTMKVFLNGWRQSLAAVAVAAVLSPAAGDSPASFAAEDEPAPVKVERERHDPAPVKVEREGERRDAPAAKERREGERREGERREGREGGDQRRPDAREGREGGGEEREARMREIMQRREQLQKEAAEIRHKLESLKDGQDAEARELKGALERIERQMHELQAALGPRPDAPNRERVQARLEELKAAIHRAAEAGRRDEAERLEREAHELMRMLEQRPGDRPPGAPEGADMERRMQHLRVAIENLRAAGLHEPAEALARQAEGLMRGRAVPGPHPEAGPRPEGAPHLERAVQDLSRQMEEMRRQMDEIRNALKTLAERR